LIKGLVYLKKETSEEKLFKALKEVGI